MTIDFDKFYCEEDGQLPGLPAGWDAERADFGARLVRDAVDPVDGECDAVYADREFARENGHHIVAAGGIVGTWPVDPDPLSDEDALGGVRIGYPGANDPYTCGVCGKPVRYIP